MTINKHCFNDKFIGTPNKCLKGYFTSTCNIAIALQNWRISLNRGFDSEVLLTCLLKPWITVWNYRLNAIVLKPDIGFYSSFTSVQIQTWSIRFLNGGIWTRVFYAMSLEETIFNLNKILALASWKYAFLLKTNYWIGRDQRFLITVSATRPLLNFGKHLWNC